MKALYYGDNLQVLRDSIANESVDLVYLVRGDLIIKHLPAQARCLLRKWCQMRISLFSSDPNSYRRFKPGGG